MSDTVRRPSRLAGTAASMRSQHLAGVSTVTVIAAIASLGVVTGSAPALLFAVGAGAGYSLSGSV